LCVFRTHFQIGGNFLNTEEQINKAIDSLYSILKEESKKMTGNIEADKNNGSFYNIRKLISAIHILQNKDLDSLIKVEYTTDTWSLSLKRDF